MMAIGMMANNMVLVKWFLQMEILMKVFGKMVSKMIRVKVKWSLLMEISMKVIGLMANKEVEVDWVLLMEVPLMVFGMTENYKNLRSKQSKTIKWMHTFII